MRELPSNFHAHQHGMGGRPPWILLLPANTLLPLIRAPLGYHLVHPRQVITQTALLIVLPLLWWWFYVAFTGLPMPDHAGHLWLMGFAVLSLLASLFVFIKRIWGWRKGEDIHSEEAGYSWLCWLAPLPVWLCELFIVPGLVALVGWEFARTVSLELGYWLMGCAASLLLMASWEQARKVRAELALRDGRQQARALDRRLRQQETGAQSGPDAVSFGRDTGTMTPERMTWFRPGRGAAGERRDYADLG